MASVFTIPILQRVRNRNYEWQKYTDVENEIIEDAYNEKMVDIEIDGYIIIDFQGLLQNKKDDEFLARPINRFISKFTE